MTEQFTSSQTPRRPTLSFPGILAWGAMIATLLVIAYAGVLSPEASVRVHVILQGFQVIVLTLVAGLIAAAVHSLGLAAETRRHRPKLPSWQQNLAN